ncbi:hypothetical protein FY528_11055 [Hymenobacter lutimineralis]|uniref:Chemotaxis protein CheB n=1 Tax=Hymenobacter lutimineralis TaxID=2606448 RepID=A0A5D6V152_9BACT|nr:hypothetical protein FY528_11055 [Hymenobacter lutimineralis]
MPESALRAGVVDYVIPLDRMGGVLLDLIARSGPVLQKSVIPDDLIMEASIAERVVGTTQEINQVGRQVPLSCPDCGGALWEMQQGAVLRYRCHTGHAFTADSLLDSSHHALEETLWVALRMMEERKNLYTSMASRGEGSWSVQQEERIEEIKVHINRLREFLINGKDPNGTTTAHVH